MKTKIKRVSRSTLAVILAIMMVFSTMLVGTISVNATISGLDALYFTPDTGIWGSNSATFGLLCKDSESNSYQINFELIDSEAKVYKATLDSSKTYSSFQFYRLDSNSSNWSNPLNTSNEFTSIPDNANYFTKTSDWWNAWSPDDNHGTWSTYSAGSGDTPTQKFYYEYYTNTHNTVAMTPNADGSYSYETNFQYGSQNNNNKFRITSLSKEDSSFNANGSACSVSAYKRDVKKVDVSQYVITEGSGVTVAHQGDTYLGLTQHSDIVLSGVDPSKTYVVTYKPDPLKDNILDGTITISLKSSATEGTVTVKSKLNVTNDISGTALFTATTDGTETSETVTGSTFTLTASDTDTNYNFAGWKLDGVTLTSGTTASKTISFTIKSGAENPTVTATAITLTPRLKVTKTDLIYNDTTQETVTLHAYSKVGDKTEKATNYKVTYYYLKDSSTTPVQIGDTQEITDVTNEMYALANSDPEIEANHIVGGTNTKADVEFAPTETGTYKVFAEIAGYDDGGNLVTGAYEVQELGTTLFKDDIVINVTDGSFKLPIADNDRIYAYAKTLAENETPSTNAWVASETNAAKIDTHTDSQTVKPTLGKTTDSNIRIFLPTTASSDKVLLYNTFGSDIKVKDKNESDVTIKPGEYAEVSYTPSTPTTVTLSDNSTKTLTIYKSTADGALYVNNIGTYASIDENGALSMIDKLYSGKEEGEIKSNVGALADSNGVQNVTVSKIKGRGNSTWVSANKKSFNVNFSENIKAFGFTTGKKFSLLANFKDPSLSRNKILYELADKMGVKYTSDSATVDLYLNGLYMGSYLMCQKVEVGSKELVNDLGKTLLDDLYKDSATGKVPDTSEETIKTKGFSFLIELDSNADTGDFYIQLDSSYNNQKITIKEPEYLNDDGTIPTDAVTNAAKYFVEEKYKKLFDAMSNTTITKEKLNEIIDVDSLAKYYLINEIAKNYDIGVSSTYLVYNYKEKKFYISPLWDMDVTTGNCKSGEEEYQSYEKNWTDNNSESNYFMKKVFDNPHVQSAARKLWTNDYYTTLIGYLSTNEDNLTTKALSVAGSLNCNYIKWNYPYGFQGKYDDNVQERTELYKATYDPAENTYTVSATKTDYARDAEGQIKYVSDWLQSRIAWMSKKYNTYTIGGLASWDIGDRTAMTNQGNGIHYYEFKTDPNSLYGFKIFTDYGLSNTDITVPENSYNACINFDPDVQLINNTTRGEITAASGENKNFGIRISGAQAAPVYLIYNQVANTLTLSDTRTTITKPSVKLSGSTVANEDIDAGTTVKLTAIVSPATKNDGTVLTAGTYTVELYKDGTKVAGVADQTVTFSAEDNAESTKTATFSTTLSGKSQSYTVKVTYTDADSTTYTSNPSNAVSYKKEGIKDQKIYFDPSTYTEWRDAITTTSTVTVEINGKEEFTMSIDTEDIHGFDKGVFVANITAETLAELQKNSNTITFKMVGKDGNTLPATTNGDENIQSGWIYNYSAEENGKQTLWEEYNTEITAAYPHSNDEISINTYDEFKQYLAAMNDKATNDYSKYKDNDHIVYFDNSASKWYNVYLYTWDDNGNYEYCVKMKKLPYADIWYYDFGNSMRTSRLLFKDRSDIGFGSDYQQTVDLVGSKYQTEYIINGNGQNTYLNFVDSIISNPCPIFVTQSFYLSTIQCPTGDDVNKLKYRAFNTEWQNFYTVVSNTVQTTAVDVYFDLHTAASVDSILLYHSSKDIDRFKFPSDFTRLRKLPNSTIYYASILLPYTDAGELKFTFDKFVIGTTEYKMGTNAQPAFTCINTGEVWYEYAKDGITYAKTDTNTNPASVIPSSKVYSAPVGASETNASVSADATYYYSYSTGTSQFEEMKSDISGIYYFVINEENSGTYLSNNNKFKITNNNVTGTYPNTSADKSEECVNFNIDIGKVVFNTTYFNCYFSDERFKDLMIATHPDEFYIVYTPGEGENALKGTIELLTTTEFDTKYKTSSTFKVTCELDTVDVNPSSGITEGKSVTITPKDTTKKIDTVIFDDTSLTYITNPDGSATFTMPSHDVTITDVSLVPKTTTDKEYCGVLGYNHSTATFASTEGGIITDAYVNLMNGYQNNTTPIKTGYTTVTDGVYTVIYALTSTGNKPEAKTSNGSVTAADPSNTETYKFNGWTKDGRALVAELTMSDPVTSSVSVNYVANWSLVEYVTYTFTYKYDAFDTSKGYEYKENNTIENADYVIKINLPKTAEAAEVKLAYLSYLPKIESNYFKYSFDDVEITVNTTEYTAEAKATNAEKKYNITLNNSLEITQYYYQNIATYSNTPASGKVTVWKDEDGNVLYVGNTYNFRVTRDFVIEYSEIDSSVTEPFTYVNDATYEFYTSGSTERVKFNILVDNYIGDTTVSEYGVIYFFTDSTGVPVDSTISYDVTVDEAKLEKAALNHGNGALKVYNPRALNNQNKYIFAPTLAFNDANKDRYLRVYSYFKDEEGNIVLSKNYVLASIRMALT